MRPNTDLSTGDIDKNKTILSELFAKAKIEPKIRVVHTDKLRASKQDTAPVMQTSQNFNKTFRETKNYIGGKSIDKKLASASHLPLVGVSERMPDKSNEKESIQATAEKTKWRITNNLKAPGSSSTNKKGFYIDVQMTNTKRSATSLRGRVASSAFKTHDSYANATAEKIEDKSAWTSTRQPQQSMTQLQNTTIGSISQFATVSAAKPKTQKCIQQNLAKKAVERERKVDVSYLMDDLSCHSPHTRMFYKEINDEINRIALAEALKKKQLLVDQRSISPQGSEGERSNPYEQNAPFGPSKSSAKLSQIYTVGGSKTFNPKSYTSIDGLTGSTSNRFIKDVLLPNVEQKTEQRADYKAKRKNKGSFLDLLLDYSNIMPQDDVMLKDMLAKVPGGLSEEPAGRRAAMLTKEWIKGRQDKDGKLAWGAAELAIIEIARQVYLSCSERGECILMALSAYKQTADEREAKRLEDYLKLKAGIAASSNSILAEYNEREKRTVLSLAESMAEANSTKKELESTKAELASLEASCIR